MMKHHHKFLVGVKNNLNLVKKHLDAVRGEIMTSWEHYRDDLGLYVMNFSDRWDYREEQPRSGKTVTGKRRIYIHLCFNDQRCTDERTSFARYLSRLEEELRSGKRNPAHEREYSKYFEWHQTPKRGMVIQSKEDAIREKQRNFGYFALLSNSIKDPVEAVTVYRTRDVIEKAFEDLKSRLSMRRMSVSSAENFEGKLFIQFVALMYLSYIKRRMEAHGLFKGYTMQTMLDSLDIIECWQQPGMAPRLSEVTEGFAKCLHELATVSKNSSNWGENSSRLDENLRISLPRHKKGQTSPLHPNPVFEIIRVRQSRWLGLLYSKADCAP